MDPRNRLSFQLSHDLAERLNERIKRLSLLDEGEIKTKPGKDDAEAQPRAEAAKHKSHVHIRGYYVIRQKPDGQWFVEVMPRVRIGPPGSPETLAHPVKFKLPKDEAESKEKARTSKDESAPASMVKSTQEAPPTMTARQYEQILERVYFSVATEIYKQIQQDVKRKIELLPTNYFRAVALFHEAEDYANSNTLDAYADARKLYDEALNYFDPDWKPLSGFFLWRLLQRAYRWLINLWLGLKRKATAVWPRLGRVEVMWARAEIGYANMLLYRRILAALSGQRINPGFEAPRVAEKAVERVRGLSPDVAERRRRVFDAYVTLALAHYYLNASRAAEKDLSEARALDPVRAEMDSRFLFVSGEVEPRIRSKLNLYRRAVELDPRFEVAQFSKAYQVEMVWRTRPSLERNVAELVLREYDAVATLNPGSVGTWANQGYVRWLLATGEADLLKAREAFEDGREYKEIKHETFVAELDHGLARIAAEQGDFDKAYSHYISAVSANLAQGMSYGGADGQSYFFQFINRNLLQRVIRYKEEVERNFKLWASNEQGKWQSRSFPEVVEDLIARAKTNDAHKGLELLFKCISPRLSPADKEQLNDSIGEADLGSLAKQLKTPRPTDLLTKLRSPGLAGVIEKYLPTLRVRKSVYAFVLNEYGEACYSYYLRSGSDAWGEKARVAHQEAIDLNPQYVVPRYRLYQMESDDDAVVARSRLEEIVDIEPDWSDAILALAEVRARLAQKESEKAAEAMQYARALRAEAQALERKLDAEKKSSSQQPGTVHEGQLGKGEIDDPRLIRPKPKESGAPVRPQHISRLEDQGAIDLSSEVIGSGVYIIKKKQKAGNLEQKASEHKQRKKVLAKEAVDGIKELLPFKWAESALNEELEQSRKEGDIGGKQGEKRFAGQVAGDIRNLLPLRWAETADPAGKEISALLENKKIKWERELEDIHVRALQTWAKIRPFLGEPREARVVKGRVVLRGEELLCHIRRHFWPDDFELHRILRDLSKSIVDWEAVPGHDNQKLKEFLAWSLGAKWPRRAAINKPDPATITLSKRNRALTLKFDEQHSRATLILPGIEVEDVNEERFLSFSPMDQISWSNIPGSDGRRLLVLLRKSLGTRWLKKARLAKNRDDTSITLTDREHTLSLKIDRMDSGTTVITHEFKVAQAGNERDIRYLEYERTSNEVLRDAINRNWQEDRTSFVILTLVRDKAIEAEERQRIFAAVSKEDGLANSLYKWLGEQWFEQSVGAPVGVPDSLFSPLSLLLQTLSQIEEELRMISLHP